MLSICAGCVIVPIGMQRVPLWLEKIMGKKIEKCVICRAGIVTVRKHHLCKPCYASARRRGLLAVRRYRRFLPMLEKARRKGRFPPAPIPCDSPAPVD